MAYSKTRTRFHPNLLNSPPHSDRLIVHYTLPPGVTLWMLNVKSRALNSSVIVRRACQLLFFPLFTCVHPLKSCWAGILPFSSGLHAALQEQLGEWALLMGTMAVFFFLVDFSHDTLIVWVWTSVSTHSSEVHWEMPLCHFFAPCPTFSSSASFWWRCEVPPCSPLPGNCLLAAFPGSV